MDHRPFEDWLLYDEPLTSVQKSELQAHLRSCTSCAAIANPTWRSIPRILSHRRRASQIGSASSWKSAVESRLGGRWQGPSSSSWAALHLCIGWQALLSSQPYNHRPHGSLLRWVTSSLY